MELIRQIFKENDVNIIKVQESMDHIYIFGSIPPHLVISKLSKNIIVKSSFKFSNEQGRNDQSSFEDDIDEA